VTVLEVIQRSTDYLVRKGIESPRLQAELMLAEQLRLPRLQLYLNHDRELREDQLTVLREWIKRRGGHEPLQYILGHVNFCGVELEVSSNVLIPRPETEVLAEHAWQFLEAREPLHPSGAIILDFATGSGCLAIALACRIPTARILAVDLSWPALVLARHNAQRHQVADRIQFWQGNSLAALSPMAWLDLVVSNPPYIPTSDLAILQPEVRDYEPRLALDGGPDGLAFFRSLAREAALCLRTGGRLLAEFGDGQEALLPSVFSPPLWRVEAIRNDNANKPRILVAVRE